MTVVGIRRVDVDRDGTNLHGFMLHCNDEDASVDYGNAVEKFFVSDRICVNAGYSPAVGDRILPIYPKGMKSIKTIIRLD